MTAVSQVVTVDAVQSQDVRIDVGFECPPVERYTPRVRQTKPEMFHAMVHGFREVRSAPPDLFGKECHAE